MIEVLLLIGAYLIGSVPTAVWVSKGVFGLDIREYGSGNAGATNTFRVLGPKAGTFVMAVDMLKGVLAVRLSYLLPYYTDPEHLTQLVNLQIGLGLVAVVGHIFPIWANFRGGKGIATLFGLVLAIQPLVALCCVGVFLMILFLTRYVSLSSIIASIAFPVLILFIFNEPETFYRIFAIAVALMVVLTHQKNITRLLKGVESKVPLFKNKKDKN
ncbi:glycerol-3-phosphate acyltransferase PlsY [Chitinophaga terrae (ex Kim and Jung 2007)]|jgi:glycerol-3-phosphate acyltransferase PlsY|uniref:Glycerol-3-phosphate acyltransferase n=1 Tax=Chitinophaga terrae (ex Kim and Jung 2007) TaxID=408074 RepID=A0A1H4C174_9BACT|nr:glycerol-3-phosphate 1-O-acyltransferase PlsY [Chitinophaga terrae (ex Kim and Jung 2007)]MDQ0108561.1 glycerol-3-phosphate acyltransferase PlsY [Chitinophaga terrae (ex Kim and Jung 2007)]GEP91969.1 glycerol-3-phosphate acyltransferase [Chitinophaga terrae (ex Kim and Jung 2007)]SEA54084.1 glycerol-3-phosphate acyltransferase PlsY [Chitinophaga terrae (ex Kim and Jung 2007)]